MRAALPMISAMRRSAQSATVDSSDVRFRVRTARAGIWLSLFCCAFYAAYYAMTWSDGGRRGMVIAGAACAGSLALFLVPLDRLMRRSRTREAFFLGWSFTLITLTSVAAGLDGGAGSPLRLGLFLPLIFAALSYPFRSMLVVGIADVLAYVALALVLGGAPAGEVFFVTMALGCAAWMCAWQAHLQGLQRAELSRVSRADPLTGCLNRRGFVERAAAELSRAARGGEPLGLILVDLDHFKEMNDRHGHAAGDELLCWTVATLEGTLRPMDAVGRLGGDEFAVLLPGAGAAETAVVAERICEELARRTPASCGAATFPADGADLEELHHHADLELYAVKHHRPVQAEPLRGRELSWAAALAHAVDLRMSGHHEHSTAVARYAGAIGERLGFGEERLARLRMAAMLHDVGKVAVPESILRKPGRLTEEEMAVVRTHPAVGAEMIARIEGLQMLVPWIRHCHEHIDGSGYPDGLSGDAIPLESRVLLVADAFDAMTSDRAYRSALSAEAALAELRSCAGRQFDPRCVDELVAAFEAADVTL